MWCSNNVHGLVCPYRRCLHWLFFDCNCRSICRALMPGNCRSVSALGLCRWRIHGIQLGRIALSLNDHGYPATFPNRRPNRRLDSKQGS